MLGIISKAKAWLVTSAVALAVGASLGAAGKTVWDHKAPFGLGLAQQRDAAREDLGEVRSDLATCVRERAAVVAETHRWKGAYDRLELQRQAEARSAASALAARSAETARQCNAAFQAGVTAGRQLRGDPDNANANPDPGDAGGDDAGGVRDDFRGGWAAGAVGHSPRPRD